jgi:tetratricopeptide (TPR) repeat protein
MGREFNPAGRDHHSEPSSEINIPELLNTALSRHRAGDPAAAETLCLQVLAQEPAHPDALLFLGVLRHQSGKSEEAAEYISKAISLKPGQANFHREMGHVQSALGDPAGAEKSFREAIRLDPGDFEALFHLGVLLKTLQKLEAAAETLEGALRLRPGDIRAQLFLGAAYYEMNDIGNSEELFRMVLQTNPDLAEAHFGLGAVFWLKKDHAGAEDHLRRAIRLKPGSLNVYFFLGAVFADAGKFGEENAVYKEALALWPDNAALGLLSDIYLPPICQSSEEIDERRKKLGQALKGYDPDSLDIAPKDLPTMGRPLSFFLAFQGRDDLELKSSYADLFSRSLRSRFPGMFPATSPGRPAVGAPPRGGAPPRIGIVATQPAQFLLWIRGLINYLTPGRFRTSIVCTPECHAGIAGHIDEAAGIEYLIIDRNFEQV